MARFFTCVFFAFISCSCLFGKNLSLKQQLEELKVKVDLLIAENAMKTQGATTKTANPQVDGHGWSLSFDAIAWHLTVEDTEYAYRINVPPITPLPSLVGQTQRVGFGWDFAFRIGVGKKFCNDQWDAGLIFTHFKTEDDDIAEGNPVNGVVPLKGAGYAGVEALAEYGKSIFSFDYNDLVLELGRNYFISKKLALKPSVGIRTSWVQQRQITRFTGAATLLNNTWHIYDSEKFWGIGPRGGISSSWYFFRRFQLYGLLNFSFLYSYFDVERSESLSQLNTTSIRIKDQMHQFTPAAQYAVGLGWGRYLNDKRQYLELKFGYDGEYFWGLNQMLNFYMTMPVVRYKNTDGNVSMHGVSLKATLNF